MKKKTKTIIISASLVVVCTSIIIGVPFMVLGIRTNGLQSDYSYLKDNSMYTNKVEVSGLSLVKQHISCGYATIEMLSSFYEDKVSEDDLSNKNNGEISTSSSDGFLKEINASIPSKTFKMESYLKNDDLLKYIYSSLQNNDPVAIEWAALYENEWTLHFSIVSALDIVNEQVEVYNPYGYIENISIEEFLNRTTFNAYTNMPLFLNFGFAFGAFHKNTIFLLN